MILLPLTALPRAITSKKKKSVNARNRRKKKKGNVARGRSREPCPKTKEGNVPGQKRLAGHVVLGTDAALLAKTRGARPAAALVARVESVLASRGGSVLEYVLGARLHVWSSSGVWGRDAAPTTRFGFRSPRP